MNDVFQFVAGMGMFFIILGIVASIFWIWMLVDCLQNTRLQPVEKLVWVLVIFFLHIVGALIYFFVGRQQRVGGL
jgi:hypothetical protein